jgi:hypothetical protein
MSLEMDEVKMFLFTRWMATGYADTHLDEKGLSDHEKGFNKHNNKSVLNRESGMWYKRRLEYFNNTVYPYYTENGTVDDTLIFLNTESEINDRTSS